MWQLEIEFLNQDGFSKAAKRQELGTQPRSGTRGAWESAEKR